jgi:hypothetical protein
MMDKTFYAHLVDLGDIEELLREQELAESEHTELMVMVKETIHYRVVTEILTYLPQEHHEWFLESYTQLPHHEGFLEKLKEVIGDIEDKISRVIERVKAEIKTELQSPE